MTNSWRSALSAVVVARAGVWAVWDVASRALGESDQGDAGGLDYADEDLPLGLRAERAVYDAAGQVQAAYRGGGVPAVGAVYRAAVLPCLDGELYGGDDQEGAGTGGPEWRGADKSGRAEPAAAVRYRRGRSEQRLHLRLARADVEHQRGPGDDVARVGGAELRRGGGAGDGEVRAGERGRGHVVLVPAGPWVCHQRRLRRNYSPARSAAQVYEPVLPAGVCGVFGANLRECNQNRKAEGGLPGQAG